MNHPDVETAKAIGLEILNDMLAPNVKKPRFLPYKEELTRATNPIMRAAANQRAVARRW